MAVAAEHVISEERICHRPATWQILGTNPIDDYTEACDEHRAALEDWDHWTETIPFEGGGECCFIEAGKGR